MNIENNLSYKERSIFNKVFTILIIFIIIFVSFGIYVLKDFGIGYEYYQQQLNPIKIGIVKEENFLEKVIDDYLNNLTNDGYYIVSHKLNMEIFYKKVIVNKNKTKENDVKQEIIKNLDISVLVTKLSIENDKNIYYFKTEKDCMDFINELNKYIPQKYKMEGLIENYKLISSKEFLLKKIEQVKQENEIKQKESDTKKNITSRGASKSRTFKKGTNHKEAPLAKYSYVSSPYGKRHGKMHTGVDFAAPCNTEIYAWKDGVVESASWQGGYGNYIIINHNDNTQSRYAHCNKFAVKCGQNVKRGQLIGYVGTTGNSTGYHLHFEIKINGQFVNPLNYL